MPTHTHTYTHTHYKYMHFWRWVGRNKLECEERKWKISMQKRRGGFKVQGYGGAFLCVFLKSPDHLLLTDWLTENGVTWTLHLRSLTFASGCLQCLYHVSWFQNQQLLYSAVTNLLATSTCSPKPQETQGTLVHTTETQLHQHTAKPHWKYWYCTNEPTYLKLYNWKWNCPTEL